MLNRSRRVALLNFTIRRRVAVLVLTTVCLQGPAFSQADQKSDMSGWSVEQIEVWATVEAYSEASHRRDLEKYMSFWHPEFWGWHNGDNKPTSYRQRAQGLKHYFDGTTSVQYTLEPMKIQIVADGNAAIVHYRLRNTLLDKSTGEKESGMAYWTDYLVREDGRWKLISDHGGNVPEEGASLDRLDWILGKWKRLNERPDRTSFESWEVDSPGKFAGTGVTLQGKDTVFGEGLSLLIKNGRLYYVADVSHNSEPTYFEVTKITDGGFVCENPQHDFPKKIEYDLEGDRLAVVISGDGRSVPFRFQKIPGTDGK